MNPWTLNFEAVSCLMTSAVLHILRAHFEDYQSMDLIFLFILRITWNKTQNTAPPLS